MKAQTPTVYRGDLVRKGQGYPASTVGSEASPETG